MLLCTQPVAAEDTRPGTSQRSVEYVIVVTGGELLAGVYADGHTHFLTRTLRPLGLQCVGVMFVDDKRADIQAALRFAADRAPLTIVTGGLGPTDNDITRETISEFTGIPIAEQPDVLRAMARRFGASPEQLRANLRRQTQVPTHGTYLNNANGSAVGLVFEGPKNVTVALPGPPRELQAMVRNELVPYLSRRFGTRMPGCSLTLRFVGLGQSQIDQTLDDHVPLPADVTLSSQFEGGRVDFTFALPDDTPKDRARLAELKAKILKHLGDHVYGEGETTMEQCVVELLAARNQRLVLVEAGTGGRLAMGLDGADGAQRVVAGAYVAPAEEELRRLLQVPDDRWTKCTTSAEAVGLLATRAAELTGSQWVVVVGEPHTDDRGTRYIEVAINSPDAPPQSRRMAVRSGSPSDSARLSTYLLDQLRRRLR